MSDTNQTGAPQTELHYKEHMQNIFKRNPEDLYRAGEEEPALRDFRARVELANRRMEEAARRVGKGERLTQSELRALANQMFVKALDTHIRRDRANNLQKTGKEAPGELEQRLREGQRLSVNSAAAKRYGTALYQQLQGRNPDQIYRILTQPRSEEARDFTRQAARAAKLPESRAMTPEEVERLRSQTRSQGLRQWEEYEKQQKEAAAAQTPPPPPPEERKHDPKRRRDPEMKPPEREAPHLADGPVPML